MKVAVSGAGGFVGSHVVAELARRGLRATLIIRPGSPVRANMAAHDLVEIDIQNPPVDAFERMGCPDVLVHLAWGGLPNYKSLAHFERELPAQYGFLSGLVHAGLNHLVITGTCLEYGMQSGPLNEEMPARPVTPYGFAKEALLRQLEYLKQEKSFALTWARLFYMYGEGQAGNSLWPQLKSMAERGEMLFNMSGGEQLRDYLPVAEVARYLVALATMKNKDVGVVNVCSGKPTSVRRLVEHWIELHGWLIKPNLGYYPYPDYEPLSFWGERRKLDTCMVGL